MDKNINKEVDQTILYYKTNKNPPSLHEKRWISVSRQYRYPRSKKKRIRKKWHKNPDNFIFVYAYDKSESNLKDIETTIGGKINPDEIKRHTNIVSMLLGIQD